MRGLSYALLIVAGVILLAIGVPIWVTASKEVDRAYEGEYLATQGIYALCRHPIYGNAIFFTIPGILLFFRSWLLGFYHSPRLRGPYTLLGDGDVVTVGEIKVRAIATPGHTPGAMSYLVDGRVLFTGDTLALRNGQVRTFYRLINVDTATQKASIGKLARLEGFSLLCTAHTGCTTECARAMRHWPRQENRHANHETE